MGREDQLKLHARGPMTADEKRQMFKSSLGLAVLSVALMVIVSHGVCSGYIRFHTSTIRESHLENFAQRLEYAVKWQTPLAAWLLFMVLATIAKRASNRAYDPQDPISEKHVIDYNNILRNSFESIFIAVLGQYMFIAVAHPLLVLKFIPAINVMLTVGRLTFFLGYPFRRSFGFMMTLIPNTFLVGYALIENTKCLFREY